MKKLLLLLPSPLLWILLLRLLLLLILILLMIRRLSLLVLRICALDRGCYSIFLASVHDVPLAWVLAIGPR